ncbi:MAG: hypothetical protein EOP13_25145 [Pseudomonas sp.]|uniref:hypothetical protein n=1 Tax=Pseudomonas sp. TaxID=306 RepID=UPI0011F57A59|nr:hypothetical protein [Pseudomonas sp.]RZI68404.1 MAG: hypothetical protein EOP13_25145 [Pseudomonas sp.]
MAHARALDPVIRELLTAGVTSLAGVAQALNNGGYTAIRGGSWAPTQVEFLLQRLDVVLKPPVLFTKTAITVRRTIASRALADVRARTIAEIREGGVTLFAEIARKLNARGITTRFGNVWDGTQVRRVMIWLELY